MRSTFRIINIITEAKNIFVKFTDVLKSDFHFYLFTYALEINRRNDRLLGCIQVADKTDNTLRFMKRNGGRIRTLSFIRENNCKLRIQIGCFVKTIDDLVFFEAGSFEDIGIGKEIDKGPCFGRLTDHRQKPLFERGGGIASFIGILIDLTVSGNTNGHAKGKCIDHGRADSVQSSACFIGIMTEFPACMKCRINHALGGDSLRMHSYGNSSPVVLHGRTAIRFQCDMNLRTKTR